MFLFIHFHPFPSHSSSQPLLSHSLLSISIQFLSFPSIIFIHFRFLFWFLILKCSEVSCSIITDTLSFHPFLFSFLYLHPQYPIHFLSSLRIYVSQIWILYLFVRILVNSCSFVVLTWNTLSQLDVIAFVSDVWFENSSIERWGNERMNTWRLNGIGVVEAVITAVDSIRC